MRAALQREDDKHRNFNAVAFATCQSMGNHCSDSHREGGSIETFMEHPLKRFTATDKWDDKWFRVLSPRTKLLWMYLLDHCDNSGVVDPDLMLASFQIGETVDEKNLTELGNRLQTLPNGKLWIPKFIRFQFGDLNPESRVHASVIKLLSFHAIEYPINTLSIGYVNGMDSPKDKEKDKNKDIYSPESRAALHWLNEKSGKHFRETEASLGPINARLKEKGVDIDGVKMMIERQCNRWLGTRFEEYLTPRTLFGKENFDNYYASKEQPINTNETQTERPKKSLMLKQIESL